MPINLKVGFVGLRRGSGLVRSLAGHPQVEVAALCDLDETSLTKLGADFGVSDRRCRSLTPLSTRLSTSLSSPRRLSFMPCKRLVRAGEWQTCTL